MGVSDRTLLKDALAIALAKSAEEKERFDETFDRFFDIATQAPSIDFSSAADDEQDTAASEGESEESQCADADGSQASEGAASIVQSSLGQMVLDGDSGAFQVELQRAAREMGIERMWLFTQKGVFTHRLLASMGLKALDSDILRAAGSDDEDARALAERLREARAQMQQSAREFVEQQFELFARNSGERLHEQFLERMRLSEVTRRDHERMRSIIRRMAKRLAILYARRIKRTQRGNLDVRKTLRRNYATDGVPIRAPIGDARVSKSRASSRCVTSADRWRQSPSSCLCSCTV